MPRINKISLTAEELERLQRLASVGTLAATVAHEINNLLTPVLSYAALARANEADRALAHKALERAIRGVQATTEITQNIMGYTGGAAEPQPPTADVARALDAALACMVRPLEKEGLTFDATIEADLVVAMTPIALQQVLMNLLMNARDALEPKGTITVRAAHNEPGAATITVADDGPGIPQELVPNLFEPFTTASQSLDSHGLGLSACALLIGNANGRITVETTSGQGTCFTIDLPLANQLRKTA